MSRSRVLVDVKIVCETPELFVWRINKTEEEYQKARARALERWISDFTDFIRDHRSQDPIRLDAERVYEDKCSFCGAEWTEDFKSPHNGGCCDEDAKLLPGALSATGGSAAGEEIP